MPSRSSLVEYYRKAVSDAVGRYSARTGARISLADLKNARVQRTIAVHPNIGRLSLDVPSVAVKRLCANDVSPASIKLAQDLILSGRVFSEEAFAGDATRIKKPPQSAPNARYVLPESKIFFNAEGLLLQAAESGLMDQVAPERRSASDYAPFSMGSLHLYKAAFEIFSMALKRGMSADSAVCALKSQVRLVVLPEARWEEAAEEIARNNYYGFHPENILFMVQAKLPGLDIDGNGNVVVDQSAPKMIWNHGAMKMQLGVENEIFRAAVAEDGSILREPVSDRELFLILERMEDGVSYSVEDMSLIESGQIADLSMIALAYAHKQASGAQFLMEVTAQNQTDPQKGGFLAWDPQENRALMIETSMSGALVDLPSGEDERKRELRKIGYLNRNFNHTMDLTGQMRMMRAMLERAENHALDEIPVEQRILGFPHAEIKGEHLYPQPPQGDFNLALKTVFAAKDPLPQISGLKIQENIPAALSALYIGSRQKGLDRFIQDVLAGEI